MEVKKEAESLVRRGHEVVVITSSPDMISHEETVNGVKIFRFFPVNLYPPNQFFKYPLLIKPLVHIFGLWNIRSYTFTRKILFQEKPDIVHIHNFKGLSLSVFSAARKQGIPLVFTSHDYALICPRNSLLKACGQLCESPSPLCRIYCLSQKIILGNKVAALVIPSEFIGNKLKTTGFFTETYTLKLPIGINLNPSRLTKSYNVINILYVGSIIKSKGVHILINAFNLLNQGKLKLHIVGAGPDLQEIEELAKGNPNIIIYGSLYGGKLDELRSIANISVVPSIWYDNAPVVINESFNFSIPVIGSKIGGIPELIEHGKNGMLVKPGDVGDLKTTMLALISDLDLLNQLEEGAFRSSRKYNNEEQINRIEYLYEHIRNIN